MQTSSPFNKCRWRLWHRWWYLDLSLWCTYLFRRLSRIFRCSIVRCWVSPRARRPVLRRRIWRMLGHFHQPKKARMQACLPVSSKRAMVTMPNQITLAQFMRICRTSTNTKGKIATNLKSTVKKIHRTSKVQPAPPSNNLRAKVASLETKRWHLSAKAATTEDRSHCIFPNVIRRIRSRWGRWTRLIAMSFERSRSHRSAPLRHLMMTPIHSSRWSNNMRSTSNTNSASFLKRRVLGRRKSCKSSISVRRMKEDMRTAVEAVAKEARLPLNPPASHPWAPLACSSKLDIPCKLSSARGDRRLKWRSQRPSRTSDCKDKP